MTKKTLHLIFILCFFLHGFAFSKNDKKNILDSDAELNNGSHIMLEHLTENQIENLVLLSKVWGFVKYHHPIITTGQLHWDYALFRVMPKILAAPDRDAANAILHMWIVNIGAVTKCQSCASLNIADIQLQPRLQWINGPSSSLNASLKSDLVEIYLNRSAAAEQFYVAQTPGIGNPKFIHELDYNNILFPDSGFQLLALFRFWNIVEYWAPYRDQIGEDWDGVLRESIVKVGLAKERATYQLELMAVIARINDTHANLWSSLSLRPPVGVCSLPIITRFIEGRALVTDYANNEIGKESGLQVGDIIEAIDGNSVDNLVRIWRPYYAASNEATRLRDIARGLSVGNCGLTKVKFQRKSGSKEILVNRVSNTILRSRTTHDRAGATFQLLFDDIAYIKLSSIRQADIDGYLKMAAGTKGMIIDIRNYPSDFVPFALGKHFVDKPTEFVRFTVGDLSNPGSFHWGPLLKIDPHPQQYEGKVMILLDETSQSQAEYTAMALRTGVRAKVIGSTTAGADGNVSLIPLPGGLTSKISGIGVFYPDKRPTQRIGIVPDIEVIPTIHGIRTGLDEVLETAIVEIRKN